MLKLGEQLPKNMKTSFRRLRQEREASTEPALSAVRSRRLLTSEETGASLPCAAIRWKMYSPEAGPWRSAPTEYGGEAIDIGFNPAVSSGCLKIIREPEFELELGQSDRDLIGSGAEFYVLMPINLG